MTSSHDFVNSYLFVYCLAVLDKDWQIMRLDYHIQHCSAISIDKVDGLINRANDLFCEIR